MLAMACMSLHNLVAGLLTHLWLLSPFLAFFSPAFDFIQPFSHSGFQLSCSGHVLEFGASRVVIHDHDHGLTLALARARPVSPQRSAETAVGAGYLTTVAYFHPWPKVTVLYRAQPGVILKSEYFLEAGFTESTIRQIRVQYSRPVELDSQGRLLVRFPHGNLLENAPTAWQEVDGRKIPVPVSFRLHGTREAGFCVRGFDSRYPLRIDPSLTWNTFLGGTGNDTGDSIAVDGNGNVWVGGTSTMTWGSPQQPFNGGKDAFAAKLDSNGTMLWNTFLGSAGDDEGNAIALDGSGNAVVVGNSDSTWGSPARAFGVGTDAFAAQLDSNGSLVWSTFLGGAGADHGRAVALDGLGNVVVGGDATATWGGPVRVYTGNTDAFVAKLDNHGSLLWNTFLGDSGTDSGTAVAVNALGDIAVGGYSDGAWGGSPIREYSLGTDAFAAKLDGSGNLLWNTFLGGGGADYSSAITLDAIGNVVLGGTSFAAWGIPVNAYNGGAEAFAAKVDSSGVLIWHTFLGGSSNDFGNALVLTATGSLVFGGTSSGTWGAPQQGYHGGSNDGFVAQVESNGTVTWNTFVGGSGDDQIRAVAAGGIVDIYAGGLSSFTWGAPKRTFTGPNDAFGAKIIDDFLGTPAATYTATSSLTPTRTGTSTPTLSPTPTFTNTNSPTYTRTGSPTSTVTNTASRTATGTQTDSPSSTSTVSPTHTSTNTASPAVTSENSVEMTQTVTHSPTPFAGTPTPTPSPNSTLPALPTVTPTLNFPPTRTRTVPWVDPGEKVQVRGNVLRAFGNGMIHADIQLPDRQRVTITLYDQRGERVRVLADQEAGPGIFQAAWDGLDTQGRPVRSGVFILHFQTLGIDKKKQVVVVR